MHETIRDIRYALRGFARTPLLALTVVLTVALGLGLVAVAFTFLNTFLFRIDRVPNVEEMFAVQRPRTSDGERVPFTRTDLEALRRDTNVFTDAYAEVSGIDIRTDGGTFGLTLTTGNFFDVLHVNAALGRTLSPSDDQPGAGRAVMVLSDEGWDRVFARDPHVLGRAVLLNGNPYEVVGVMPRGFRGLSVIPPDYWVPLSTIGQVRPADRGRESSVGVRLVGRLKPGVSRESALAALSVWAARQQSATPAARGTPMVDLVPWRGTVEQPVEAVLITGPLFFAFGLILLIACANVANLLLARGLMRQREIGIRVSVGAARGRIVRQLMTESLLLAVVAAAVGFAISRVALRVIVDAMMTTWPPEIGDLRVLVPDADWRVYLFLVIGAACSSLFFGLIPAVQATRIEPVRTMRGEVLRDARPGRARSFLIGMQVSASALLLICAGVFLRSAFIATTADPGMPPLDTVIVGIPNERVRTAMVQAIQAEPLVAAVAASSPAAIAPPPTALAESAGSKALVAYRYVSPEYFNVLDIAMLRGRTFAADERSASHAIAVVSESTARTFWPNADPLGQLVRLAHDSQSAQRQNEPALEPRTYTVVGVVRDVPGSRMAPFNTSVVYIPVNSGTAGTTLVARVHGDAERARHALHERLIRIEPGMEALTVGALTRLATYFLQVGFWSTVCLGGLALALTLSGLFSVLSYLVEQRTREIGVRIALGATSSDVMRLVVSQSFRPVAAGLLTGGAAAAALSAVLLSTPAAVFGQVVRVLDPMAYGASLLIILMACLAAASIPATRAARLDPARTLRQE